MRSAAILCLCACAALATAASAHSSRRLLIEGGTFAEAANGETIYVNPPQEADSCTNVAPDARYTCEEQREFGACDEDWMKEGNYCLYTCGRAKNCGSEGESESQGSDNSGNTSGGESESESSASGSVKPGNPNECDDIRPPGEYTCQQQRDFGKCREWYIVDNHFCAQTCGLAPCPAVTNLPRRNGTSTSIAMRNATRAAATTAATSTITDAANATNVPQPILTAVAVRPVATAPTTGANESGSATPVNTVPPITGAIRPNITNAPDAAAENATVAVPPADNTTTATVPAETETEAPVAAENTTMPADNITAPVEATVVPAETLPATQPVAVVTTPATPAPVVASPAVTEPVVASPAVVEPAVSPNPLAEAEQPVVPAAEPPSPEVLPAVGAVIANETAVAANETVAAVNETVPAVVASPALVEANTTA